jgi:3-oxoacyl-[acyl-carrier-protein] synthase II
VVAKALYLKGVNISFAPGQHAGLQSLAYAYDSLAQGQARQIIAGAADEIYPKSYWKYNLIDFLCQGEQEKNYQIRLDNLRQKVLGEGAGMLVLEDWQSAQERQAHILGEVLGYGMSMDAGPFIQQNLDIEGLMHACSLAIKRSEVKITDIDLVLWAPQGNIQDKKVIDVCKKILETGYEQVPLVTTTFNTGYIESASVLVTLACALLALQEGNDLWPQLTGLPEIDNKKLRKDPRNILVLASSDLGYNFAVVVKPEKKPGND